MSPESALNFIIECMFFNASLYRSSSDMFFPYFDILYADLAFNTGSLNQEFNRVF